MQDNRPVAFASRALSEAETRYAMVEKEFLGLTFACKKFHNYIYSRKIKTKTDHKPLVAIMSKEIHKIPSGKLQRMRLKLLNYDIDLEYVPGKYMNLSDYLSRHFLGTGNKEEDTEFSEVVHSLNVSDEKIKIFQKETRTGLEWILKLRVLLVGVDYVKFINQKMLKNH